MEKYIVTTTKLKSEVFITHLITAGNIVDAAVKATKIAEIYEHIVLQITIYA